MMATTFLPRQASGLRSIKGKKIAQRPMTARRTAPPAPMAMLGGEDFSTTKEKRFITREQEPKQAWVSQTEADGKNPMSDPVTIVGLIIFFFPFVALGIALVSGAVDFDAINSY